MPSPFPGMNPYLENPEFWSGVHHWLINGIARVLGLQLRPKYYVAVAKPLEVTIPLPETVKEGYLEIRKADTKEVITAIEILSPKNKKPGIGRQKYEHKRSKILGSATNFVEIDLLRQGQPMTFFAKGIQSYYRILVSRSKNRPKADLYTFNLQEIIPAFPLPLLREDEEPILDLQKLLNKVYDLASYDLQIDYSHPVVPALGAEDEAWVRECLKQQGLL